MEHSKIINHINLTKTSVQRLLNELFSLEKDRNENMLIDYVDENNINFR